MKVKISNQKVRFTKILEEPNKVSAFAQLLNKAREENNELNSNNAYNVSLAKLEASYKNGQISAPEYRFLVNQLKEKN